MRNGSEEGTMRPSFVVAGCLTIAAVGVFGWLFCYLGRPLYASFIALLSIEGPVLLACSIQVDNDPQSWRDRIFGTEYVSPVRYSPLFFYGGFLFLALAGILGALA